MSYYQDVVTEYLRADRTMFVNTECLIQLDPNDPISKERHWYCDVIALSLREEKVYLCEVSYSKTQDALSKRLRQWSVNWQAVCDALVRDCGVSQSWQVQPWAFVPKDYVSVLRKRIDDIPNTGNAAGQMPTPQVTTLESVAPWKYDTWNRKLTALAEREDAAKAGEAAEAADA